MVFLQTYRSSDPFTGVHVGVPDNGWLLALPTLAPEVNTSNVSPLDGFSNINNLSVGGEGIAKISEELPVLPKSVVGLEVGCIGESSDGTLEFHCSWGELVSSSVEEGGGQNVRS